MSVPWWPTAWWSGVPGSSEESTPWWQEHWWSGVTGSGGEIVHPPGTALTVLAAIVQRANADAILLDLLPGGFCVGLRPRGPIVSYAEVHELVVEDTHTTKATYARMTAARLTAYTPDRATLHRLGIAWKQRFRRKMTPLLFDEGNFGSMDSGPMVPRSQEQAVPGTALHIGTIDMVIHTTGSTEA